MTAVLASPVDQVLAARLARAVAEAMVREQMDRDAGGLALLTGAAELDHITNLVERQLDTLAGDRLAANQLPLSADEEHALRRAVLARVVGLGRIQPYLDDPEVSDIHIRGGSSVWLKLRDGSRRPGLPVADSDDELVELIRLAAARQGRSERRFDAAHPELNLQLADGSRLFATMAVSAQPSVVIRKHRFELASLGDLMDRGMVDHRVAAVLAAAVRSRRNLIVAGGTGTGKTTLLRALLNEVPPSERLVTIEDAYELGLDRFAHLHPDHDMLQSRPANIEGKGEVTMLDLARMALRMDPDRVVVGEVRGGEALPMLLAMSQGNDGSMCTMHADSARTVFPKLAAYVAMAGTALPVDTVNLLVATAVHLVVHVQHVDGVRRVTSIREVVDADGARIVSNEVFAPGPDGAAVPAYPFRERTLHLLERHGLDPHLLRAAW
jgi:pilus assembly protein CpaF